MGRLSAGQVGAAPAHCLSGDALNDTYGSCDSFKGYWLLLRGQKTIYAWVYNKGI